MQQQLFRIRNKDYSKIDEQLYSNLGITEDLDVTLTQLAELQKYLKKQISNIEDEKQREAVMKASKVIGCDLGEVSSACHCGRQYIQKWQTIQLMLSKAIKCLRSTKQSIKRQLSLCLSDISEEVTLQFQQIAAVSVRKAADNQKLKSQIQQMQSQIQSLRERNREVCAKLDEWNLAEQRCKDKIYRYCTNDGKNGDRERPRRDRDRGVETVLFTSVGDNYANRRMSVRDLTSVYTTQNQSPATQRLSIDNNNNQFKSIFTVESEQLDQLGQGPRIPMPLRRQSRQSSLNKACQSLQKNQSIPNNVMRSLNQNTLNKCQTAKVHFSSYNAQTNFQTQIQGGQAQMAMNGYYSNDKVEKNRSPNTVHKIKEKENELLRMKGMDNTANRKSTKKLKLFSLI